MIRGETMIMENLADVVAAMRKLKERWCDPEVIDDEEELSGDVIPFLAGAFPILEDIEAKLVLALEKLDKLEKNVRQIGVSR